jgi:L-ascorbate metabolism protein UlaG (beta-lactamase superfamily)
MEITFHGANALTLNAKTAKVIVDPVVPGQKVNYKKHDIVLLTQDQQVELYEDQILIHTPGEYEAREVSVKGVPARSHMDEDGKHSATMYRVIMNGIRVAVLGHVHPNLTEAQLEELGRVDVVIVPVGGNGYTLDAEGARKVIKEIEPAIVIPTHFADKAIKYEVPQNELKAFTDEIGAPTEEVEKLKLKAGDLPEQMEVKIIKRTA